MQLRQFRSRAAAASAVACLAAGVLVGSPAVRAGAMSVTAPAAPAQGALLSVAATSATNAWAVGFRFGGQANRTLIEHWNGTSWRQVKSLSPGGVGHDAELLGVTALSKNNAWAVGFFSDGALDHTLVEHWNGTSWRHVPSPGPVEAPGDHLTSVVAISPANVWAVGTVTNFLSGEDTADTFHWNGHSWKEVAPPNPGGFLGSELLGVTATSAGNVWAVGDYPDGKPEATKTLIVHWTGRKWKRVPSPNPTGDTEPNVLSSVSATSGSNAWAVGFAVKQFPHAAVTVILRWNGKSWKQLPSPRPGRGDDDELSGVAALSASDAFAVGNFRDPANRLRNLVVRWNGRSWSLVPSPTPPPPARESGLSAVAATSARNAWAVGFYVVGSVEKVIVLHWNGRSWRRQL